jgi:cation diffusion facilitator family transporter
VASDTSGRKATLAAFAANVGVALAKFVAWLLTGSASMLAESVHSVADSANQGLLLLGRRRSRQEANRRHPFGFGRERFFWAFVVAMVLFSAGGLFALAQGIQKVQTPHELTSGAWAIGVLVFAFLMEGLSLRTAVAESRGLKHSDESWLGFVKRTSAPELAVVLVEDTGALLGVVIALGSTIAAELTGNSRFDAIGSIGIGALLIVSAFTLAREMKSLLIGEAAQSTDVRAIRDAILSEPIIAEIEDLRTEQLGPDDILVVGTLRVDSTSAAEIYEARTRAEVCLRAAVPAAQLIYFRMRPTDAAEERWRKR